MKMELQETGVYFWDLLEDPNDTLTVTSLKTKIAAFRELFGLEPEVWARGKWYGPIDGIEEPEFSLEPRIAMRVEDIGRKYVTLRLGHKTHRVELVELSRHQEDRELARIFDRDPDSVRLSGASQILLNLPAD